MSETHANTNAPVIPPAPVPRAKDLPSWLFPFVFARNTLGVQPKRAYEESFIRRRIFGTDSLLINDPRLARSVLSDPMIRFSRPAAVHRVVAPLGQNGLFLATGTAWREQRRMLAPVFRPATIPLFLRHFEASAAAMIEALEGQREIDLWRLFHHVALDSVLRALFTMSDAAWRRRIAAMVEAYIEGPGRPGLLDGLAKDAHTFGFALARRRRFSRDWRQLVSGIIQARRDEPAPDTARDMLDMLLAARHEADNCPLSDDEIMDQCSTMIVAGHETTARLLFWVSYILTLDLPEQDRLREEAHALGSMRGLAMAEPGRLPRMNRALLEALRLYPPVTYLSRVATQPAMVGEHAVEPGTQIWISPWIIHRHKQYWPAPDAFLPQRFEGIIAPWSTIEAFLPFGAGPRICIGAGFAMAEAQVIMATLLSHFRLTTDPGQKVMPVARIATEPDRSPVFRLERVKMPLR